MRITPRNKGVQKGGESRLTNGNVSKGFVSTGKLMCCGTVMKYNSSSREGNGLNSKESHDLKLKHPATFPDKFASDFIRCFTKEGMIVLDPFLGSGTTVVEAKKLNRHYVGFDIGKEYCSITEERIKITL